MDVKKLLGARIKEYRLKNNYSQQHFAELIEIDNKHLSNIELGKNMPNPQLLLKISDVLHIEIKELFDFYHLQPVEDIKREITNILEKLREEQLRSTLKYLRSFVV